MSPPWSNRAQKSSADSQRAGESIARIRWPKIEGLYFRENEAGAQEGSQRAQMSPTWWNWAQKSSADSQRAGESIARIRCPKKDIFSFSPKRNWGPWRAKGDLRGGIGPKKVLQSRSELASRLRASDAQKRQFLHFLQNQAGAPGVPQWTCVVESGRKKFCRLAANWRVDCAHQMPKKGNFCFFTKTKLGILEGPRGPAWSNRDQKNSADSP